MPLYEVLHSYPLDPKQKASLAERITHLHSTTFTTPSLFVNVHFADSDASARNYFVGGKCKETHTNRILATVRTSEKRTKADFDQLAEKIEEAWYDAINGEKGEEGKNDGKRPGEVDETSIDREAKRLLFVVFHPMIAARENGVTIPGAGEEGAWLKSNMEHFKKQADMGDEDFKDMVEEIEKREDLKKLI